MTFQLRRLTQHAGLLLAILGCAGCGTFHRDWQAVVARPATPGGIEGAWTGTWLSHSNGHSGNLRAIVTRRGGGEVTAHFHATYWGMFASEYTVRLEAVTVGDKLQLRGREDLGRVFLCFNLGEYTYDGVATGTEIRCVYGSKLDGGVFDLTRP